MKNEFLKYLIDHKYIHHKQKNFMKGVGAKHQMLRISDSHL